MYQRGKRDAKSKAVKTKTNIILKVSCGEQHGLPGCLLISLIIDQDFTWRQASDPKVQYSNMQVSSTNIWSKRAWGEAEGGFGRLQAKQSSGESNNYIWVFTDRTKGRIKVHRKLKVRLWESIWLIRTFLECCLVGTSHSSAMLKRKWKKTTPYYKEFYIGKKLYSPLRVEKKVRLHLLEAELYFLNTGIEFVVNKMWLNPPLADITLFFPLHRPNHQI